MHDAARLQILERQLAGVAQQMGAVLVRAALSSNIKERRDSSCALFTADGNIIAQAAHIPVHIGSMHHAVAAVMQHNPKPGEVWITNDPYAGGTHLPDITAISCVLHDRVLMFTASRAHHADVGGRFPGSMSIHAARIEDEGVRILPIRISSQGNVNDDAVSDIVRAMRQPQERRGDLLAQLASLEVAHRRLPRLIDSWGGKSGFETSCSLLVDYGRRRAAAMFSNLEAGSGTAMLQLELPPQLPESEIRCSVTLSGDGIVVDLSGSSQQLAASYNCPRPVTEAAVWFVVRSLFDPELPTSGMRAEFVDIRTNPGTIVDAQYPAAVAAGNVEVSSAVVDVVMDAIAKFRDVPAAGQGTMNNMIIGNENFNYYETIAGGQGASSLGDGPSAIHVAMTNTLNTPLEALESSFPLKALKYAIRRDSGGSGKYRGGNGVVRTLQVLEPCTVSLLAQRRRTGPPGRAGGGAGKVGEQFIDNEAVSGMGSYEVSAGSVIEIRTPGGGGWGTP